MLSNCALLKIKAWGQLVNVFHREIHNKKLWLDGYERIWQKHNFKVLDIWCYALLSKTEQLPATLDISRDFTTTTQIGRYK